jgi:hypothetical protein
MAAVDLHWMLTPRYYPFAAAPPVLWDRSIEFDLDGGRVRTLSNADLMIFMCVHGTKDGWPSLTSIMDVAALSQTEQEWDWAALMAEAGRIQCRRMVLLGLTLASRFAAAPMPVEIMAAARDDAAVQRIAARVERGLLRGRETSGQTESAWRVPCAAIERAGGRVRYVLSRLLAPTVADWEWLRLPAMLFALYYVIRPLRLALVGARATIRRLARPRLASAAGLRRAGPAAGPAQGAAQ